MKAREQSVSLGCRWTVQFRSDNSAGCSEGLAVISPWFKSVFHWILQVEIEWALQIERTERSPVNSTIRLLSPAPAAHCLWWGQFHLLQSVLLQGGQGETSAKNGFLDSLQDLWTEDLQPHGAWLRFQESGGLGRYYDALRAALVLSLRGVTKVRESQMAVELQALTTPWKPRSHSLPSLFRLG